MTQIAPATNPLAPKILSEIRESGPISLARFMDIALYDPSHGYYRHPTIGQKGDFMTSVSVGPLFGALLAAQCHRWHQETGLPSWTLAEAGAHDGRLARDILHWRHEKDPHTAGSWQYRIFEPSPNLRAWQKKTLHPFSHQVRWITDWKEWPAVSLDGVFLSNELLDAFPVHQFRWHRSERAWIEWGVAERDGRFVWSRLPKPTPTPPPKIDPALEEVLPDGFVTETAPRARDWWLEAARRLRRGRLMTLDYGWSSQEFFQPDRANGSFRAYHRHRHAPAPLDHPGFQDLTSHVHFSELQEVGESAGLTTETFESQERFLTRILTLGDHPDKEFPPWTHAKTRQFQTLTHPDHLGRPFRVLVQKTKS